MPNSLSKASQMNIGGPWVKINCHNCKVNLYEWKTFIVVVEKRVSIYEIQ